MMTTGGRQWKDSGLEKIVVDAVGGRRQTPFGFEWATTTGARSQKIFYGQVAEEPLRSLQSLWVVDKIGKSGTSAAMCGWGRIEQREILPCSGNAPVRIAR